MEKLNQPKRGLKLNESDKKVLLTYSANIVELAQTQPLQPTLIKNVINVK